MRTINHEKVHDATDCRRVQANARSVLDKQWRRNGSSVLSRVSTGHDFEGIPSENKPHGAVGKLDLKTVHTLTMVDTDRVYRLTCF